MHADYLFYFFKLFFLLNISFKNAVMLSKKKNPKRHGRGQRKRRVSIQPTEELT
jgi:hypothetical protein